MTALTNSLEGVTPSGTTLTAGAGGNTGGASGNFLDVVTIGASATLASDSSQAAHGSLSVKVATGASAVTSFAAWTTSMGSQATVWFRFYLFITANPANVLRLFSALQGVTGVGSLALTTTGLLRQLNAAGATIQTGAVAVPANQWVRVEGFMTGSATVGQVEHKLFKTLDSVTADETLTSAASQSMTGAPDTYRFGLATSLANAGPYWLDDLGLSSTAYLGPVGSSSVTSTGSVQLPRPGLAGTATETEKATGSVALRTVALAGTVTETEKASGSAQLRRPGLAGTATETEKSSGSAALSRLGLSGTVTVPAVVAVNATSAPRVTAMDTSAPSVSGPASGAHVTARATSRPGVSDG